MPAIVSAPIASGAAAGRMPQSKSPMCRSLPSIGGPALPICAFSTMRDRVGVGPHRQRDAEVANHRRDDVAVPAAVGSR